jgi:hypothetical protein
MRRLVLQHCVSDGSVAGRIFRKITSSPPERKVEFNLYSYDVCHLSTASYRLYFRNIRVYRSGESRYFSLQMALR